MTATSTPTSAPPLSSWARWSTVWLLCLGVIIAYIDRSQIAVAIAGKDFNNYFGLTPADRGLIGSVFAWTYAALQIPAGLMVDRWGVKKPYAVLFAAWCLVAAAMGRATTFWQLIGLRLLLGVGEAVVTPASIRWIRFNVPERLRGTALGIYMSGTKYGPGLGALLSTWLYTQYGWRTMFVALGVGGLLWLVPWWWLVRDNDRELEQATTRGDAVPNLPFSEAWKTPLLWGILVGTFCYNYFVFFSTTWLPSYFAQHRKLSLQDSGFFSFVSFSGMATIAIAAGFAADMLIARGWNAVKVRKGFTIAGFLIASTELLGALSDSHTVALTLAIVSLGGLGLATANYWALTQTMLPGVAVGSIAGAQNTASNLAAAVAPLLTGWLIQWTGNFLAPMYAICGFLVLGLTMYLFVVQEKYAPKPRG
jgi:MFS family permease